MKRAGIALCTILFLAAASGADGEDLGRYNARIQPRIDTIQRLIDDGYASGNLVPEEVGQVQPPLEKLGSDLAWASREGKLTPLRRRNFHERLDLIESEARALSTNNIKRPPLPPRDIAAEKAALNDRLDRIRALVAEGARDRTLTRAEARELKAEIEALRSSLASAERQGRLGPREIDSLSARIAALDARVAKLREGRPVSR